MAYLYFIKQRVLLSMAYRFEAISAVLVQFVILTVSAFFWTALYRYNASDTVQGTTLRQMLVYSTISIVMSCFLSRSVEGKLRSKIRDGSVAADYLKPVSMFGMYFAEDVGGIVVNLLQRGIPVLLFAAVFVTPPLPATVWGLGLFIVSVCLSFIILWLIAAIFGMLNFWAVDIGNIGGAKDMIIAFLSGSIIPVWFFPQQAQMVLQYTPFIYIYQTPISIYIGKTSATDALGAICIQVLWCAIVLLIFRLMQRKAVANVLVQGG